MSELDFIHRFTPGRSGRTLLLLHGTGGDENQLIDLGQAIDPAAALLSPRGQVLENGHARFFRRLAEGVFDEEDVGKRAHELSQFIARAISRYQIDASQLVAVGYSNGANIASAMLLLGVASFPRAILLRAMVPLSRADNSITVSRGVLISNGQFDPIAPPPEAKELSARLKAIGAQVDLAFQAAGHELTPADLATAQKWLAA